jgi:hypothetical protein
MVAERYSDWRETQTIFPVLPEEQPTIAPPPATVTAMGDTN